MLKRLHKELHQLQREQPDGIHVFTGVGADDLELPVVEQGIKAQIMGPPDSPFEGGIYDVSVKIPARYPFEPPNIRFQTRIYHPNIDSAGRICLDILKLAPSGSWKPIMNISTALISIRLLMTEPNPDDPLDADIAKEYQSNRSEYRRKAMEMNARYAMKHVSIADPVQNVTLPKRLIDQEDSAKKESVPLKKAKSGFETGAENDNNNSQPPPKSEPEAAAVDEKPKKTQRMRLNLSTKLTKK